MLKSQQNFHDYFPRLNFYHLQRYAKSWLELDKFKEIPIKRIDLYHYSNKFKLGRYAQYAVLFVVDEKIPEEVYERFEAELAYDSIDDDTEDQKAIPELEINAGFQNVYREQPENNFLSEWQFLAKKSGEKMPKEIMSEKPRWVFFPEKDLPSTSFQDIPNEITAPDLDGFVKSLIFQPDTSDTVKIQMPGKKTQPFTYNTIGFNRANTDEWKTFLNILQESNTYNVGQAGQRGTDIRKEYDKKQGTIKRINKKLIGFLREEFSLQIPEGFKIYEPNPEKGAGWYKFKFKKISAETETKSRFEKFTKEQLLNHLKNIYVTYSQEPADYLRNKIKYIVNLLIEKHGMEEKKIYDFCNPTTDKEEIHKYFSDTEFDPYENIEDSEPDY